MWGVVLVLLAFFFAFLYFLARPALLKHVTLENTQGYAVFVTGAASGIGAEVIKRLLKKGCFVFAADINEKLLNELYAKSVNVKAIVMDVTKPEDVDKAARIVKEEGKGLFALINSAGIAGGRPDHFPLAVAESDVETEAMKVFQVNTFGLMRTTRAMFSFLHETAQKLNPTIRPRILNIASVAGIIGASYMGYYVPSKFAVVGYSDSLRNEVEPMGIRVDCIQPGFVETPLIDPFKKDAETLLSHPDRKLNSPFDAERKRKAESLNRFFTRSPPQPVARVADIVADITLSDSLHGDSYIIDRLITTMIFKLLSISSVRFQRWWSDHL